MFPSRLMEIILHHFYPAEMSATPLSGSPSPPPRLILAPKERQPRKGSNGSNLAPPRPVRATLRRGAGGDGDCWSTKSVWVDVVRIDLGVVQDYFHQP